MPTVVRWKIFGNYPSVTAFGTIMLLTVLTVDNDTKPLAIRVTVKEFRAALNGPGKKPQMGEGASLQDRSQGKVALQITTKFIKNS